MDTQERTSFLKRIAERYILVFTVLFWIINLITWYPRSLDFGLTNAAAFYTAATMVNIAAGLLFLFFACKIDTIKDIGFFSTRGILKGFLLGLPVVCYWIYSALGYASIWHFFESPKIYEVLLALLHVLSIGFVEELAMRGVLLPVLLRSRKDKKHGFIYAVLLSSFAFGCLHFYGYDVLPMAVLHVIEATMGGMFFAAVFLLTKNIWSAIIAHAFYDFLYYLQFAVFSPHARSYMSVTREVNKILGTSFEVRGRTDWAISFVFILPVFVIAVIYLKKVKQKQLENEGRGQL